MAECNSSTVDMEVWRVDNEPWMSPVASHTWRIPRYFLGESSEVNVRISKKPWGNSNLYRLRHASTGVIYPAGLGLCSEQSLQKVYFFLILSFTIMYLIKINLFKEINGNDAKIKRNKFFTRHFLTAGCSLQHEHCSELALYPKTRLY